ncbi:MAG TPA: Bax inhibitor-1 family protein [Candidatus Saccharimonadales bacterium]|nr:Bax inhibitor-1 family protein [Candidatus Saccharimonadales bacterium]
MSRSDDRRRSDGLAFGDQDRVFDRTGTNRSGGRVLEAPTFYLVAIISTVLGYGAMAVTAYMFRDWDPGTLWYIAALVGVLVSMIAGSAYAIKSQSWFASLLAYLTLVAGAFGILFGPFVREVGAETLAPAAIITAALMVALCLIGLAIPADLHNTWFSKALDLALLGYLFFSMAMIPSAKNNPSTILLVAYIGIGLFALITVRDMNRAKYIAHKDMDNAVDVGLQMWLNSVNILLRIMQALATKKS